MLPREKRLTSERDFKRVYQKGSFFSVSFFNLNYSPNRTPLSRIGIVVSKKVAAKAVDRNKIKRQFREATRLSYDIINGGYDIIISVKKDSLTAPFQEIKKEIEKAFSRIGKK
jgi:ribonuclease P protein component